MSYVVEDLFAETLFDQRGRNLPLSESRDARLTAVALRHPLDLRVHDITGNFHGDAFFGFAEVDEVGFHDFANCTPCGWLSGSLGRPTSDSELRASHACRFL